MNLHLKISKKARRSSVLPRWVAKNVSVTTTHKSRNQTTNRTNLENRTASFCFQATSAIYVRLNPSKTWDIIAQLVRISMSAMNVLRGVWKRMIISLLIRLTMRKWKRRPWTKYSIRGIVIWGPVLFWCRGKVVVLKLCVFQLSTHDFNYLHSYSYSPNPTKYNITRLFVQKVVTFLFFFSIYI